MANYIFSKIAKDGIRAGYNPGSRDSRDWFREAAREITTVNERRLMASGAGKRLQSGLQIADIGRMFMFFYNAKTKDTLPYWDRFPLAIPIKRLNDGFLGLNLHYLPHLMRAKLFDSLYKLEIDDSIRDSKKLAVKYSVLQSASQMKYFQPCLKRYLFDFVQSKFLYIPAEEWDIALFMPTERFQKDNKNNVWKDSRNAI